jgi:hypothetical protein
MEFVVSMLSAHVSAQPAAVPAAANRNCLREVIPNPYLKS